MFYRITTVVAVIASTFAAAFAQNIVPVSDTNRGYLIGPGDVLTIKALGEPTFDIEKINVDEEGKLYIPYVETPVVAKCKTERELQAEVARAWSKYLKNPQINLRVTERLSRPPVSVYGEVTKQSQFDLTRQVYLLEIISVAGGVTDKSSGVIQVFRTRPPVCSGPNDANNWIINADTDLGVPSRMFSIAALRQGREEANPEILPGDIIVVQKAAAIYVTGEVIKPGELGIPEGGLPLTQAIAMASGQTREAKMKDVKIYRRKPGQPQPEMIVANVERIKKGETKDVMLEPGDIVEVGKAPKRFMDYLIEFATGVPNRIPIPIRPI
jgi:polysaccharide export outer membrane protein